MVCPHLAHLARWRWGRCYARPGWGNEWANLFGMKRPAKVQRTYHTRISDPDVTLDEVLGGYAEVYDG